jgi:3-oxoacyl-[acyl-carrier protein] reductase
MKPETKKNWVITGTSRGLGFNISNYLLEKGEVVVGCSRGPGQITHENYHHFEVDVTDEKQVRTWAKEIKTKFVGVDVLVGNVGRVKSALFLGLTPTELYREIVDANLTSTFLVCREFSKLMIQQRSGRIINISSAMTSWHEPGTTAYSASKSAVVELTKVMANELAPMNITCNIVSPALLKTQSSDAMGTEWRERIIKKQTVAREIDVSEVCHALEYFASSLAASVTGQVIHLGLVN